MTRVIHGPSRLCIIIKQYSLEKILKPVIHPKNDLNVALYGNEEQFNVENGDTVFQEKLGNSFYYTKETCETRHEWSDILVLISTRSASPVFRS